MLFSSPRFFVFLAVLLLTLSVTRGTERKKRILALGSCVFYAAWDYRYLGLLLLVSVIDYQCAAQIARSSSASVRKAWLAASVVSNLGILAFFKYCNFFIDNMNLFLPAGHESLHLQILLPAGISFYTFKSMSYTIDVYRGEIQPCKSHLDYTTFVTFFPELIAGPIVRASVFLPQMERDIGLTRARFARGASLFVLGISKKLLIADHLAPIADAMFARPDHYAMPSLWLGVAAYGLQIYTDFSGYSDMAIGTAKLIGYDLPENFAMPYLSATVTEFWRRWHITLSQWLRDYLYIPLGGNRHGATRTYLNLAATMLLGGLWHGASWNFVLWGGLHGVALAAHRFVSRREDARPWPRWLGQPLTLLFVLLCWIPFRAPSFHATGVMFVRLFSSSMDGARFYPTVVFYAAFVCIAFHVLGARLERAVRGASVLLPRPLLRRLDAVLEIDVLSGWFVRLGVSTAAGAYLVTIWVLAVFYFGAVNASPFIYFQF